MSQEKIEDIQSQLFKLEAEDKNNIKLIEQTKI